MMSTPAVQTAQARIADCLELDKEGQLVQRHDHLNLAGLDLTDVDLAATFDVPERGLEGIGLASLRHLRYLDLTGNRLAKLPSCVPEFTKLIWLGLNFNALTELPSTMGRLTSLKRLYLRGNKLRELPAAWRA